MSIHSIKVLSVFGTRPEAIKMAPVLLQLESRPEIESVVCVSAQHRDMLDEALRPFGIRPHFDLDLMRPAQSLAETTSAVIERLSPIIADLKPTVVLVQGDTTTTFAAAVASFYQNVPIGHVEAGLRTGNLAAPWPEEFNRRSVDLIADLLWAPTDAAAETLRREGARPDQILITGNTAVDALRLATEKIDSNPVLQESLWSDLPKIDPARKLLLVTGHRRESFSGGLARICEALNRLAARPDVEIVWPVHPNPQVTATIERALRPAQNIHLIAPAHYLQFVALLKRSDIIITDSGGIQEEAPSLGKPVLVTREETERPEAIAAGTARLVGTSVDCIHAVASELLDDQIAYGRMVGKRNPFGDGRAARRIVDSLLARYAGDSMNTGLRSEGGEVIRPGSACG